MASIGQLYSALLFVLGLAFPEHLLDDVVDGDIDGGTFKA